MRRGGRSKTRVDRPGQPRQPGAADVNIVIAARMRGIHKQRHQSHTDPDRGAARRFREDCTGYRNLQGVIARGGTTVWVSAFSVTYD